MGPFGWKTVALSATVALASILPGCTKRDDKTETQLLRNEIELVDIAGVTHHPFDDAEVKAIAFVFFIPDCPIANSYAPELNRLLTEYMPRGLRLFLIQVDPQTTIEEARTHARQYEIQAPVVMDKQHMWARKIGATVTPEAAVLSPKGVVLYRGRIDNRYVALGKRREHATAHDLRDALDAILTGNPISQSQFEAVGCPIPGLPPGD